VLGALAVGAGLVAAGVLELSRVPGLSARLVRGRLAPALAAGLGALEIAVGFGTWASWAPARFAAVALLGGLAAWQPASARRPVAGALPAARPGPVVTTVAALALVAVFVAATPAPRLAVAAWVGLLGALVAGGLAVRAAVTGRG